MAGLFCTHYQYLQQDQKDFAISHGSKALEPLLCPALVNRTHPLRRTHTQPGLSPRSTQKTGVTERLTQPVRIFVGEECSMLTGVDPLLEITGSQPKPKDQDAAKTGLSGRKGELEAGWPGQTILRESVDLEGTLREEENMRTQGKGSYRLCTSAESGNLKGRGTVAEFTPGVYRSPRPGCGLGCRCACGPGVLCSMV